MEGPGMSLFQGAASIHINNSAQDRLEEQEELEDQKRRNEELQNKLANAFDDLLDDDEASSVNSSGNFTLDATRTNGQNKTRAGLPPTYVESLNHLKDVRHGSETPKACHENTNHLNTHAHLQDEVVKITYSPYAAGDAQNHFFHQEYRGHVNGINNYDARQEHMNNEQLKVMYEMRVKECQHLASQIEKLDVEIESLRARLGAAVNDRDKAELSLQEAHHLLASSKHKMIELEQKVASLTEKLIESDQDKEQLKLELRSANMSLQDIQQRLHTMQAAHTHDTDTMFREQQDRHREEMDRMQNDLVKAKNRLDEKENEIKILEKRCKEKERDKEEILIEKGATINRLANELEAAQSRLVSGETPRLKEKVSQLTTERNAAKEQVKELGSKLEVTAHELVLCRNKLVANQKEYDNWRSTLHQIILEVLPDNSYAGEPPSPGTLSTLKEALARYKQQIEKLNILQEELSKKEAALELHRKQESELRSRLDEHRGMESQLNSRLAVLQNKLDLLGANSDSDLLESYKKQNESLQSELNEVRAELKKLDLKYTELEMENEKMKNERGSRASLVQQANSDLLRELERYSAQLKDTLRENGELKNLYLQACSSRDAVMREIKDLQSKMQKEKDLYRNQEKEHVERIEKDKQKLEKLTTDLNNSKEELEIANKRISELQKEFTDKQKEFTNKLNQYLADEKNAMRKEMEPCTQCEAHSKQIRHLEEQLNKCSLKLATQESNEVLIKELKAKGEFFQTYILDRFKKLQEQRSVASGPDEPIVNRKDSPKPSSSKYVPSSDDSEEESQEVIAAKTYDMCMKEKAIRDQIAAQFSLDIKTIEMNYARKVKEVENEYLTAIATLKELVERKAQEVEMLKNFVLSERQVVTEILEAKENEISVLIREHNELRAECQKTKDSAAEWKLRADNFKDTLIKIAALETALRKERDEWKRKSSLCTVEQQGMMNLITELQTNLLHSSQVNEKLQADYRIVLEKVKSMKKMVATYKEYILKKDMHVNNEMLRIQGEYRKMFLNLQARLDAHVRTRMQETRQQPHQPDLAETIAKLNEDLANLARNKFQDPDANNQ